MMVICHIGWANSIHVRRWVQWFARQGHESYVITDHAKPIEGVTMIEIPSPAPDLRPRWRRLLTLSINDWHLQKLRNRVLSIYWLRQTVRHLQPDVLHLHSLWYPGYLGAFAGFQPYVVTVLDGDVLWQMGSTMISGIIVRCALRRARMVFGESKQLLAECRRFGVQPDRLCLSHMGGVDLEKFSVNLARSIARARLDLPREYIVLSPRSLGSIYNLKTVLRSIPIVLRSVPQARFVFIWHSGTSQELEAMGRLAQELNIQDSIVFAGQMSEDVVPLYHRAADVFVSVALGDSGPKALKEAMACGAAPVVSDLPCVREWIDGENGLIVDPTSTEQVAQAIIDLLLDPAKRDRFANINVTLAKQHFDQRTVMSHMERVYYSVLGQASEKQE